MRLVERKSIQIPPDRQRGTVTVEAIADLVHSIREVGLLHPPVVEKTPDGYILLVGNTRLLAIDQLQAEGDTFTCGQLTVEKGFVPVLEWGELTPTQRFQVELEENVRRTDLPWQKEAAAFARLHALKLSQGLAARAALQETQDDIAKVAPTIASRTPAEVHQAVLLGAHLDDPDIAKAATKRDALKVLARKLQKEADMAQAGPELPSIINGDCLEVLKTLPDATFDAIVSDPPYGIGISQMSYQKSSEQEYDDSHAAWGPLMRDLFTQLTRVLKPNASGFLFCDWSRFLFLKTVAETAGFEVYSRPFIWNRAPDGRLTTPEKWPRRCYECILYFRRGTRPLRKFAADVLSYPADRDSENYHGAKKPVALYVDLCERVVGPGDTVLDPFAGSGPLLRASKVLSFTAWCIEKDENYYNLMLRLNQEPSK